MYPDANSLALFVKAAELRNLTRAAEACFITLPAASRRLTQLEHDFKSQLFQRHSRGLLLTPAGEHLLLRAREVVAQMTMIRAEMSNYAAGSLAVLRVLGNTSAMAQFLPQDMAAFQDTHGDARVVLEEGWSEGIIQRLRDGEVDLGVVIHSFGLEGLYCLPYRSDRLAVVVRDDDPLSGTEVTFKSLLERDFVALDGSSSLTKLIASASQRALKPVRIRVRVRSFDAVCRAVQSRFGIGILPIAAAQNFIPSMGLRVVPLSDAWAWRQMVVCTRERPSDASALARLLEHLHGFSPRAAKPHAAS